MNLKPQLIRFILPLLAFLSLPAGAADKPAHIGYVYPAGATQGSSVTVKIGGENVYGAKTALVSGAGVTAEIIDSKDPNAGQLDPKQKNKKKNEAVIDEIITVKITVAPDAEPGDRDLCLATTNMMSNKLVFQVGQLPEVLEKEPNNKLKTAMVLPAMPVEVNGQIMPGDTDWYKIKAVKGQRLVIAVSARALLPYIADGVPGWFEAIVSLYDAKGRELSVADNYHFNQDPVLFFDVPEDGDYAVSVRDTLYRGREDFVYRMSLGELPFITGIFPLGAPLGTLPVPVRLSGANLTGDSMLVPVDSMVPPTRSVVVTNKALLSNRCLFTVGDGEELIETKPATKKRNARAVDLPLVINGCIRSPGEKHYFKFQGTKGETVCLEVFARRLGSSLDSHVMLLNRKGKKLAENDDVKDKGEGFITHQSDSALTAVLPDDGTYTVVIKDTQGKGGDDYPYRLRLGPPKPDFELRITPAAVMMPRNGSAQVTVYAIRRNGFSGAIRLSLGDSLDGIVLDAPMLPAGMDKINLTLSSSGKAAGVLAPHLFGTAEVEGKIITRQAVPAENLMQAFLYQHLFPFHEETVLVTSAPAPFFIREHLSTNSVVELPLGKDVNIPVTVTRSPGYAGPIRLQLVDAPKGISLRSGMIPAKKDSAVITFRAESKTVTNVQGTIVYSGTMQIEREATPEERAMREAKAAREKKAREAAAGVTNAPVSSAVSSNALVKTVSGTPAKVEDKDKRVMVNRPVVLTCPAISYRIIDRIEQKATDAKSVNPPNAKTSHDK